MDGRGPIISAAFSDVIQILALKLYQMKPMIGIFNIFFVGDEQFGVFRSILSPTGR